MVAGTGRLTTQFDRGVTIARPSVGTAPTTNVWEQLSQSIDSVNRLIGPMLDERQANAGRAEGMQAAAQVAAGEVADLDYGFLDRALNPARVNAAETAYMAGVRGEIEAREAEARERFKYDPEGYDAEMSKVISGFIQSSPDHWAIDVGGFARSKAADGKKVVTRNTIERAAQEQRLSVDARQASLEDDLLGMAGYYDPVTGRGGEDSLAYQAAMIEWRALNDLKAKNPVFAWTPQQADRAASKLDDRVAEALVVRTGLQVYDENGGGDRGYAASLRVLSRGLDVQDPEIKARAQETGIVFQAPVQGAQTSGYGAKRPTGDHNGVDFAVPVGTPVLPMAAGRVIAVGEDDRSGKWVRVQHPDGSVSSYAHLSDYSVKRGDAVEAGQPIGKSGNTGRSTGPHLHLTYRDPSGQLRDPTKVFGQLAGGPEEPEPDMPEVGESGASLGVRVRRFNKAKEALRARRSADQAERDMADRQERESRAVNRERVGELRLGIVMGDVTDQQILADPNLDEGDKASLLKAADARRRRDMADQRREEREAKAASAMSYTKLSQKAENGLLTDDEIADAVEMGEVTKADAETLRSTQKKAMKQERREVDMGAGPYLRQPPPGGKATWGTKKAEYERRRDAFIRFNPDATPEQRSAAGKRIYGEVFGGGQRAPGSSGPANDKMAKLRALDDQRKRGRISDAEYRKRKQQIMSE